MPVALGQQHQELYRCEETRLARGRQAEETAGKMPKTAPSHGKSKPLQALAPRTCEHWGGLFTERQDLTRRRELEVTAAVTTEQLS